MWTREQLEARLRPPVIGMIHLGALPGAPEATRDLASVIDDALADLTALIRGGVRAVMVENFNDVPFWPDRVPPETVAAMTAAVVALRREAPDLMLGVNVLRNDALGALAIAGAAGADLIRVNVHTGAAVTDQGPLAGQAHQTLRRRHDLGLDEVAILADLRVKHAAPLAGRDPVEEARDLRLRGRADAIIVSGPATGAAADPDDLVALRQALPDCPLLIGSGATVENVHRYPAADGFIVGSSLKTAGRIDADRVGAFVAALGRGKDPA